MSAIIESITETPNIIKKAGAIRWLSMAPVITLLTVIGVNTIYFLRVDHVVGQFSDDAWYIVLARSIAEQGSYQLISSPIQGIQPNYPPGFPFLLAILLKVFSLKTEELWLLKGISVAAMNFVGLGTFIYCRKLKDFPTLICWLAAIMISLLPAYVFLATSSVMSECVFTCFQFWAVVKLESSIKNKEVRFSTIGIVIGLATAGFYTRSLGLTLVIAVAIQLWQRASWQRAVFFAVGVGVLVVPWVVYCKIAYPNFALRSNHGGNIIYSYFDQVTMRVAGVKENGIATRADYMDRINGNFQAIIERDVLAVLLPSTLRTEARSGEEVLGLGSGIGDVYKKVPFAKQAVIISLIFSLIMLIGFTVQCRERVTSAEILVVLTFGCVLIWPWSTFRFILPLSPFMICYWISGLKNISSWVMDRSGKDIDTFMIARISLFCFAFFFILEHVRYINLLRTQPQSIVWIKSGIYQDKICNWLREKLPIGSIIVSNNPAKVFLTTNHLSSSSDLNEDTWNYWRQAEIRFLALLTPEDKTPFDVAPDKYKIICETNTSPSFRVFDLGDSSKRESLQEMEVWWQEYQKTNSDDSR